MLRAFLVQEDAYGADGSVFRLETNIDDSTGEQLGFVMEMLLAAGAYDVHYIPCMMKKNRPGYILNVICSKEKIPELESIIFTQTTTIGIRRIECGRSVLPRTIRKIQTELGEAEVKEVILPGGTKRCYPEYKSVVSLCEKTGRSYYDVFSLVRQECFRED